MINYVETRDMTPTKIKTEARVIMLEDLISFLTGKYGEDNVGMIRIGSSLSKKNVLAVRIGEVEFDGGSNGLVLKIEVSAADYNERVTKSKTFSALNFDSARNAYEDYLVEKADKAQKKIDVIAEKIAED